MHVALQHNLALHLVWLVYILPALSNLILIALGIVMSLPKLADTIERTPSYRWGLAALCIIFGLIGFSFDVYQRRASDLATNTMITETTQLIKSTTKSNDVIGILAFQFGSAVSSLADLRDQLADAEKRDDPRRIAEIQEEMKESREQATSTSRQLILASLPDVIAQMEYWKNKWDADRLPIASRITAVQEDRSYIIAHHENWDMQIAKLNDELSRVDVADSNKVAPVMRRANILREQITHGTVQTNDDKYAAVTFAKVVADEPISFGELIFALKYMQDISQRFAGNDLRRN